MQPVAAALECPDAKTFKTRMSFWVCHMPLTCKHTHGLSTFLHPRQLICYSREAGKESQMRTIARYTILQCARPGSKFPCNVKYALTVSPSAAKCGNRYQIPSRRLASVRPDREMLSDVSFTPSGPVGQMAGHDGKGVMDSPPPPDERKLKLGKSESSTRLYRQYFDKFMQNSSSNSASSSPIHTGIT